MACRAVGGWVVPLQGLGWDRLNEDSSGHLMTEGTGDLEAYMCINRQTGSIHVSMPGSSISNPFTLPRHRNTIIEGIQRMYEENKNQGALFTRFKAPEGS